MKIRLAFSSILDKKRFSFNTTPSSLSAMVCSKAAQRRRGRQVVVMFFLLRLAFWFGGVCVLLPSGMQSSSPDANIDPKQAVTLANAAVSDMRGFCDRQPDACVTGGRVAVALGHKAEAGARTIYEFIATKLNKRAAPAEEQAPSPAASGEGTLTPADMQPAWHAPVPLPPRREARARPPRGSLLQICCLL